MKKLFIVISVLTVVIIFALNGNAQDVIKLKSGQELNVKILKEYPDSVRFILNDDPEKPERSMSMKFIESIESVGKDSKISTFNTTDSTFNRQCANFVFTNVIYVDSTISKDLIYQKVKQWFSEAFVSSKNVIDNADKEEGVIFGHASISFSNSTYGYVGFNIEVRCKNGKVKYLINDFLHKDACVVNAYGSCGSGSYYSLYSIGSLTPDELPEYFTYKKTGRSKSGRDKMWQTIQDDSKINTFNLIQSLKKALDKDAIKEKDNW
jgi:hypothetical protein